jgi:hypothetical protein
MAKDQSGGSGNSSSDEPNANFVSFVRRVIRVPHDEIKAKLDAERAVKRVAKRLSRVPAVSSKVR